MGIKVSFKIMISIAIFFVLAISIYLYLFIGFDSFEKISCHVSKTDPSCICDENEVRVKTARTGGPLEYVCKIAECTNDIDCENKYGADYVCVKTDNTKPNQGWCGYGITTN